MRAADCRIEYALTQAPPPASPPILVTESLYREDCDGTPAVTFTTASGVCEATTSEYREAWSARAGDPDDPFSPKDLPFGTYTGFRKDAATGAVTYCWGSTKVACESGFAGAPYGNTYLGSGDATDATAQVCGDYPSVPAIDVCWAEEEFGGYCALTACHFMLTVTGPEDWVSPSPPPSASPSPPPSTSPPPVVTEEDLAAAGALVGGVLIAVIVAPIVGVVLLVVLIIVCVCCCCKKKVANTAAA